jgi:hypothetical protein
VIAVAADLVDGADIWMIQGRCRPCFATEAFQCVRILRHFIGKEFQGDEATELRVLRLVHNTHPATAELLDDELSLVTIQSGLTSQIRTCSP